MTVIGHVWLKFFLHHFHLALLKLGRLWLFLICLVLVRFGKFHVNSDLVIWCFMIMFDSSYIWSCLVNFSNLCLFVVIFGRFWMVFSLFLSRKVELTHFWLFLVVFDQCWFLSNLVVPRRIQSYLDGSAYSRSDWLNLFVVAGCSELSHFQMGWYILGKCNYIHSFLDRSSHVWFSLFLQFLINFGQFGLLWMGDCYFRSTSINFSQLFWYHIHSWTWATVVIMLHGNSTRCSGWSAIAFSSMFKQKFLIQVDKSKEDSKCFLVSQH